MAAEKETQSERLSILESSSSKDETGTNRIRYLVGVAAATSTVLAQLAGIASTQLMSQIPPDLELNTLRFAVGVAFSALYLLLKQTIPRISKENIKWLAVVSVTTVGYNLSLYSHNLKTMPIVTLLCVLQTFRIILTLIFSKMFLKSDISSIKFAICLITIIGTTLTVIPRVEMYLQSPCESCVHHANNTSQHNYSTQINYNVAFSPESNTNYTSQYYGNNDYNNNNSNYGIVSFLVSVSVIFLAALTSTIEATVISGSPLRDENTVIFSFWYFIIGTIFSVTVTFIFEHPFIPDNTSDILLCFGHSVGASAVTYLDLVGLQILDINVYVIIITLRLPIALVLQMTILKSIIPVKHILTRNWDDYYSRVINYNAHLSVYFR